MLRPWLLQMQLDPASKKELYLQIVDSIIRLISNGGLRKGDALPSTREFANLLGVSRKTVVTAFDLLVVEGWLMSIDRVGLFVSNEPSSYSLPNKTLPQEEKIEPSVARIIFDDGVPDTKLAPLKELARAYRQFFQRSAKWQLLGYNDGQGSLKFREAVTAMLNYNRGMLVDPSEVCITRGSQMALYLVSMSLLSEKDVVLVENPGFSQAWLTFQQAKAKVIPIDVDEKGINIDQLEDMLKREKVRLLYLTPQHQYPTTVTLSLERRLKLVDLSNQYNFVIVEDDYDCEFHFGQRTIMPLSQMLDRGKYIYIGSFSKMIAPAIRLGYVVTDHEKIKRIRSLRKIVDVQGDEIMEQAVLELINTGELRRHIKRSLKYYKLKRDYFCSLLDKYLADQVSYLRPDGGLAFWLILKNKQNVDKLYEDLLQRGVQIVPVHKYSFTGRVDGIRLGYASLSEKQLEEAVRHLSEVLLLPYNS